VKNLIVVDSLWQHFQLLLLFPLVVNDAALYMEMSFHPAFQLDPL
jgi:hypothetical protein